RDPGTECGRAEDPAEDPGETEPFVTEPAPVAAEREGNDHDEEERVERAHARVLVPTGGWMVPLHRATRGAPQRPLAGSHGLLLPSHARLLVVLALAEL